MNFGESLTYWYLRLNGFFPITNFVLHKGEEVSSSADSDLLAVRFPSVYEEIGGRADDWDLTRFDEWGYQEGQDIIGLVVEVKTGYENNRANLRTAVNKAFQEERLSYAVQRLGFWQSNEAKQVAEQLVSQSSYRDPNKTNFVVAKLLVSEYKLDEAEVSPCFKLTLSEINDFIALRMDTYIFRKYADRTYFPSDLLQYIIWSRER